jgi:hypothetical protein
MEQPGFLHDSDVKWRPTEAAIHELTNPKHIRFQPPLSPLRRKLVTTGSLIFFNFQLKHPWERSFVAISKNVARELKTKTKKKVTRL